MGKTKLHTRYELNDGTWVPGTTTIIGILDKPALIHWAWKLGVEQIDYRKKRDEAADIGTIAHYLVQQHLKKEEPDLSEYSQVNIEKAKKSFSAFLSFEKQHKMVSKMIEIPLVSETYKYGGTVDWYGELDGETALMDLKSGSGLYPEMKLQIAAYKNLLEENDHEVRNTHLLRIDKETGEFHHYTLGDLSEAWEMFMALIPVYILKKRLWKK